MMLLSFIFGVCVGMSIMSKINNQRIKSFIRKLKKMESNVREFIEWNDALESSNRQKVEEIKKLRNVDAPSEYQKMMSGVKKAAKEMHYNSDN